MDHTFWKNKWQNNEIGFHLPEVNAHLINHAKHLDIKKGNTIFMPLCGKSHDIIWFKKQDCQVKGIEISPIAVSDFFEESNLEFDKHPIHYGEKYHSASIEIILGNFFDLPHDYFQDIDIVYDRAALIALPKSMRKEYAAHLITHLPNQAKILLITLQYPQHQMKGPPFSVEEEEIEQYFKTRFSIQKLDQLDILVNEPHFRKKGLSYLSESVYFLY